jgi:hypothetical protein
MQQSYKTIIHMSLCTWQIEIVDTIPERPFQFFGNELNGPQAENWYKREHACPNTRI